MIFSNLQNIFTLLVMVLLNLAALCKSGSIDWKKPQTIWLPSFLKKPEGKNMSTLWFDLTEDYLASKKDFKVEPKEVKITCDTGYKDTFTEKDKFSLRFNLPINPSFINKENFKLKEGQLTPTKLAGFKVRYSYESFFHLMYQRSSSDSKNESINWFHVIVAIEPSKNQADETPLSDTANNGFKDKDFSISGNIDDKGNLSSSSWKDKSGGFSGNCKNDRLKMDVLGKSSEQFYIACAKKADTTSSVPSFSIFFQEITLDSSAENKEAPEDSSVTVKYPNEIYDHKSEFPKLRIVRLEMYQRIEHDVLIYNSHRCGKSAKENQTPGPAFIAVKTQSNTQDLTSFKLGDSNCKIDDIEILKKKYILFKMLVKTKTHGPFVSELYIMEYRSLFKPIKTDEDSILFGEYIFSDFGDNLEPHQKGCYFDTSKIQRIGQKMEFINLYTVEENSEDILEFRYLDDGKKGLLDAYKFEPSTRKFIKIIEGWKELLDGFVRRFSTEALFIQVTSQKTNNNTHPFELSFHLSPRRYGAAFKKITTDKKEVSSICGPLDQIDFIFNPASSKLYAVGPKGIYSIFIEKIRLLVSVQSTQSNDKDSVNRQSSENKDTIPSSLPPNCKCYGQFELEIDDKKTGNKTLCFNPNLKMGNFFLSPDDSITVDKNDNKKFKKTLPLGLSSVIDFTRLYSGSFISLNGQSKSSNVSNFDGKYLENYEYTINLKKSGSLESIYGLAIKSQSSKIYFAVSTLYENYFYTKNRFGGNSLASEDPSYKMRDFRVLRSFSPLNSSSIQIQVEDLTYRINIGGSKGEKLKDSPSKGTNGVCLTNTVFTHKDYGKTMVCFAEGKFYVKTMDFDSPITELTPDKAVKDSLKGMVKVHFLRSGSYYSDYVFFFFRKKKQGTTVQNLFLLVMSVEKSAHPGIIYRHETQIDALGKIGTIISLEFVNSYFVALVKQPGEPNTRLMVYTLDTYFRAMFGYSLAYPSALQLHPKSVLHVANLKEEKTDYNYMNTVVNSRTFEEKLAFKVILSQDSSKMMKALVFNPDQLPIDSTSIVEPPQGWEMIDFGPVHLLDQGRFEKTFAILARKKKTDNSNDKEEEEEEKNSDDEEEEEAQKKMSGKGLKMWLVSDLSPSLTINAYDSPNLMMSRTTSKLNPSSKFNVIYNISSQIYTKSYVEDQKKLPARESESSESNNGETKQTYFTTDQTSMEIDMVYWGQNFYVKKEYLKEKMTVENQNNLEIELSIQTEAFLDDNPDLTTFFIRIDPLKYFSGSIRDWVGKSQSNVEQYMGVVRVLNSSQEKDYEGCETQKIDLAKDTGFDSEFVIEWKCNQQYVKLSQYNSEDSSDEKVLHCSGNQREDNATVYIQSGKNFQYLTTGMNLSEPERRLNYENKVDDSSNKRSFKSNSHFHLIEDLFFWFRIENAKSDIKLCFEDQSILTKYAWGENKVCTPDNDLKNQIMQKYALFPNTIQTSSTKVILTKLDTMNSTYQIYSLILLEFNSRLNTYSQLKQFIFVMSVKKELNQPTVKEILLWKELEAVYVASSNLQVVFHKEDRSHKMQKKIDIYMLLIYYRWSDGQKMNLFIDNHKIKFEGNFTTSETANQTFNCSEQVTEFKSSKITLFQQDHRFDDLKRMVQNMKITAGNRKAEFTKKMKLGKQTKEEFYVTFVITFDIGNSYLMAIDFSTLNKKSTKPKPLSISKDKKKATNIETAQKKSKSENISKRILQSVPKKKEVPDVPKKVELEVKLNDTWISPIENPFFGQTIDKDTPLPIYQADYFFRVLNFEGVSYMLNYRLNYSVLKQIKNTDLSTLKTDAKWMPSSFDNIFCLNTDPSSENLYHNCYEKLQNYIRTSSIVTLKRKPVTWAVIPNFNVNNSYEHRLYYVDSENKFRKVDFTSFINIRIQTSRIASNLVRVNVSSTFNQKKQLILKIRKDDDLSWFKTILHFLKIIFFLILAMFTGIGTILLIEKKKKVQVTKVLKSKVKALAKSARFKILLSKPTQTFSDHGSISPTSEDSDEPENKNNNRRPKIPKKGFSKMFDEPNDYDMIKEENEANERDSKPVVL